MEKEFQKVDILGVYVDSAKKTDLLNLIKNILLSNERKNFFVTTTYSEFIVAAEKDNYFKQILNSADFNTADGIGIIWSASYLARKTKNIFFVFFELFKSAIQTISNSYKIKDIVPEQISGADLIYDICKLSEETNSSIYFLGGYGSIDQSLKSKYPGLKVAGRYEGSPNEEGLVERINESSTDILLVAFGPQTQEKWIYENRNKLNTKLVIGLGGTFDYVLGTKNRAGEFWRSHGLEWLFRLISQPWRYKRMYRAIVVFTYLVIKDKIKKL